MSATPVPPPVWIVGAGAIGLYMAAHLSHVTSVTLVARGPRAKLLAAEGFSLSGADTGTYRLPVATLGPGLDVPPEALVVVATKATDLEKIVVPLVAALHPEQRIALVQNGLGVYKFVHTYMPLATLVRLTCWVGVTLERGKEAVVAGAPLFEVGAEPERAGEHGAPWLELLNAANLRARPGGSVAEVEWRKALLNLAVSGVCAILDERNGAILESPELREVVDDVLSEALPVAAAEGVVLGAPDVERVYTALQNTRENWNAMLQDLRRGAATEMPYLNAAVDRLARRHGLRAPVNATVARLITHLARRRIRAREEAGSGAGV